MPKIEELVLENEQLRRQVRALQEHANQQLARIRQLTWPAEKWAEYERTFGPQDTGPQSRNRAC